MLIICEIHIYRAEPVILTVKKNARGRSLWEELLRHVQIKDSQYFGLQFTNSGNRKCWLDLHTKLGKQLEGGSYGDAFPLDLRVKFWPTDSREVHDELVRCLLAVELHEWLQQGRLKCEPHTLIHIGALTLQSQLGDYDSSRHHRGYASHFCISCNQTGKLEVEMESLHQTDFCRELTPIECDHHILEVVQKLPLYGVHQFPALDKEGCRIGLGLGCNGVLVLAQETIVNQFIWSAIKKSFIVGRTFYIELHPHKPGDRLVQVGFTMDLTEVAKEFWKLCLDFHAFYQCDESVRDDVSVQCQVWRPRSRYHCSGLAYNRMMVQRRHSFSVGLSSQFQQVLKPSSLRRKAVIEDVSDTGKSSLVLQRHSASTPTPTPTSTSARNRSSTLPLPSSYCQEDVHSDSESLSGDEDEGYAGDTGYRTPTDELPDIDIEQVVRKLSEDSEKLWEGRLYYFVACEIRDTERSYCLDLELLNVQFRNQVVKSQLLSPRQVSELFGSLDLIQEFHKNFLAELERRMAMWHDCPEKYFKCLIGDILKMRMACMKLYTSYITNETKIFELLGRWQQENSDFARICAQFEGSGTCHRPVTELFYRPFQRMIHYKELLKRLLKNSDIKQEDYIDTKEALVHIETALEHVNRSTKAAENARKMMRLQRELIGVANILKRGRVCLLEGQLLKVSSKGPQLKFFFLFSDILLYAVKKTTLNGNQLVAQGILPLLGLTVEDVQEGTHQQLSFKILTEAISFVIVAGDATEKQLWVDTLRQTIWGLEHEELSDFETIHQKPRTVASVAPILQPVDEVTHCLTCERKFSFFKRKQNCRGCGQVVCSRCLSKYIPVGYSVHLQLCCDNCYAKHLKDGAETRTELVIRHQTVVRPVTPDKQRPTELTLLSKLNETDSLFEQFPQPLLSPKVKAASMWEAKRLSWRHKSREKKSGEMDCSTVTEEGTQQSHLPSFSLLTTSTLASTSQHDLSPLRNEEEERPVVLVNRKSRSLRCHQFQAQHQKSVQSDGSNQMVEPQNKVLLSLRHESFDRDSEMSSYLFRKTKGIGGWKQFWTVSSNCCLYHYKDHNDSVALSSLALPEYELSLPNKGDAEAVDYMCVFKLSRGTRVYYYMPNNKYSMDRWMELLNTVVKRSRTHRQLSRLAKHPSDCVRIRAFTIY